MVSSDGITFQTSMKDRNVRRASVLHRRIYRVTLGLIGRRMVDNDVLLLTTRGHLSGRPHTVPLLYLTVGSRFVVVASYGGRPENPVWYDNLVADPAVVVQIGRRRWAARASSASAEERRELWPRVVDAYRGYAVYQSQTDREIPLVLLERGSSEKPVSPFAIRFPR